MKTKVTEKLVSRIWQRQLVAEMVTDAGERLQVIHHGRLSSINGCDFRDAVFTIDGEMITGDVEVHVKSSQWYEHGHHRDPKYNNIALHVVWWHDSQTPTWLQNGRAVPTVYLNSYLNGGLEHLDNKFSSAGEPCCQAILYSDTESLIKLLAAAGEDRLAAKTSLFCRAMNGTDAEQVLYRAIARGLGYTQNAEPCEKVADKLPIRVLGKIKPGADIIRQALILGTAGLLPSQRLKTRNKTMEDKETDRLEHIWQSLGTEESLNEDDWCFFRVRPVNFPTRRLISLSYLIARYCQTGLLQGILSLVRQTPPGAEHRWLENGLTVCDQGYWADHVDFGITMKKNSSLLGRSKASEVAVNAVLPFVCAWGEEAGEPELRKKATEAYRRYPKLEDNELSRHMKQQLRLKPDVHLSACQHQGLIHIFKTYCRRRDCGQCPVALSRS